MGEIRCARCGMLNRVPRYSVRKIPQCGSCHAVLPENQVRKAVRGLYIWRRYFASLAVFALPLLFFAWLGSGQPNVVATMPAAAKPDACVPQPRPPMGDYLITDFSARVAPFDVETQSGLDYVVKLERANEQTFALWFYVTGGMDLQTKVPIGTYVLKYAAGNRWCGWGHYFGNNNAQRGSTLLTFSADGTGFNGHTITLYGVPHGNFGTATIPISDF